MFKVLYKGEKSNDLAFMERYLYTKGHNGRRDEADTVNQETYSDTLDRSAYLEFWKSDEDLKRVTLNKDLELTPRVRKEKIGVRRQSHQVEGETTPRGESLPAIK